jgi:hypothetical protein
VNDKGHYHSQQSEVGAKSLNKTIREIMAFLGDDAKRPRDELRDFLHESSPTLPDTGTGAATGKAIRSSKRQVRSGEARLQGNAKAL